MSFIITSKSRAVGRRAPVGPVRVDFNAPSMRGVLARLDFTTGVPIFHGKHNPLHKIGWEAGTNTPAATPNGMATTLTTSHGFESSGPVSPISRQTGYAGWRWGMPFQSMAFGVYGPNGTHAGVQNFTIDAFGTEYSTGKPVARQTWWFDGASGAGPGSVTAATALEENEPWLASAWFNGDIAQTASRDGVTDDATWTGYSLITESDWFVKASSATSAPLAYFVDFMDDSPVWTADEIARNNSFGVDGFWSGYETYGRRTYFIPPAAAAESSVFVIPSKSRAAPKGQPRINRASPQAKGLRHYWDLSASSEGGVRDLMGSNHPVASGIGAALTPYYDSEYQQRGLGKENVLRQLDIDTVTMAAGEEWTLAYRMFKDPAGSDSAGMAIGNESNVFAWSNQSAQFRFRVNGVDKNWTADTDFNGWRTYHIAAKVSGANTELFLWLDGVPQGGSTAYANAAITFTTLFNGYTTNYDLTGAISWMGIWDRAFSDGHVWDHYAPQTRFDIYDQPNRTYFIPAAAGGGGGGGGGLTAGSLSLLGVGI